MRLKVIDSHTIQVIATRGDSLQQQLDEAVNKLIGAAHSQAGITARLTAPTNL